MSRNPRTGTVSKSGQVKIASAIGKGWWPQCGCGPGEYLRRRRRWRKHG